MPLRDQRRNPLAEVVELSRSACGRAGIAYLLQSQYEFQHVLDANRIASLGQSEDAPRLGLCVGYELRAVDG